MLAWWIFGVKIGFQEWCRNTSKHVMGRLQKLGNWELVAVGRAVLVIKTISIIQKDLWAKSIFVWFLDGI
jgi:hypothetical protein